MKNIRKSKMTKGQMARQLVYLCIEVMLTVLVWACLLTTVAMILDRQIDLTAVLTFTGAAFGGELLMLLLKRVFAKKNDKNGEEGEI